MPVNGQTAGMSPIPAIILKNQNSAEDSLRSSVEDLTIRIKLLQDQIQGITEVSLHYEKTEAPDFVLSYQPNKIILSE